MCTCSSPHFLRASSLLRPDEIAVVALVERLVLEHRNAGLAELLEHQIERVAARASSAEVKATSKARPCAFSLRPAARASAMPLLGQIDVAPAGEQVLQVPLALAVAHEHEKPVGHRAITQKSFNPSTSAIE